MKVLKAAILVLLIGVASAQSRIDDPLSSKVDQAVTSLMREQKIPGNGLAVVRDGKIIKATGTVSPTSSTTSR